MRIPAFLIRYRAECILCGILLISAFLNLWNIWNQGISNTYYAAAVKSTLVNPVAGFFNSFDPAGFITVDKPPVGLWVQAAFAAVLGFRGWVLVLPQALAGIGSVTLIYFIVSHPFGKPGRAYCGPRPCRDPDLCGGLPERDDGYPARSLFSSLRFGRSSRPPGNGRFPGCLHRSSSSVSGSISR